MSKIFRFPRQLLALNKPILSPTKASDVQSPKQGLGLLLWLVVLVLLIAYPAYTVWKLIPYYSDLWSVADIVLIVFSVIAGLQILNRHHSALRNVKLFLVLNVLSAFVVYFALSLASGDWSGYAVLFFTPVITVILWWLVKTSKHGQVLFPETSLSPRTRWVIFRTLFFENMLGQVFTYSMVALLVTAAVTTPALTPSDGLSKKDTAQEKAAYAWLESHPNTLKQLMGQPTGVRPSLSSTPPGTVPLDTKTIYERNAPAVVVITTNMGSGTGFFLTADGVVATSQHVLDGANDAVVMMRSGMFFPVHSILACDKVQDFCLLKIDAGDTPFVTLTDSSVAVGDPIVVIGHPHGHNFSLNTGVISGIHEYEKVGTVFQFSAPISPGNSGGPMLNGGGQVVGVVESNLDLNDAQNLNFALSIESVRTFFESTK